MKDLTKLPDPKLHRFLLEANDDLVRGAVELVRRNEYLKAALPASSFPPKEIIRAANYADSYGDTVSHLPVDGSMFQLEGKHIIADTRTGIMVHSQMVEWSAGAGGFIPTDSPNPVTLEMRDIVVTQGPTPCEWGMVGKHVQGFITRSAMFGLGQRGEGDEPKDGHGQYLSLAGNLTISDSLWVQMGGQALQLVTRPKEGYVPDSVNILLSNLTAQDCSWNAAGGGGGGGSAFTIGAATPQGTVLTCVGLRNVGTLGKGDPDAITRGAFTAWPDSTDGHFLAVELHDSFIDFEAGDRHPYQVIRSQRVLMDRVRGRLRGAFQFVDGKPVLLQVLTHGVTENVTLNNPEFDCAVLIDGEPHIVTAGESFTWES